MMQQPGGAAAPPMGLNQQYPGQYAAPNQWMMAQQHPAIQPQPTQPWPQHQQQQYGGAPAESGGVGSDEVRSLWIGDLQEWMDENYLNSCFYNTGELVSAKVICNKQTGQSEGYGFLEFRTHATAENVLQSYNGAMMPNTELPFRLNWATPGAGNKRTDGTPEYTIFVGDLASDVTDYILQETFKSVYSSVKGANVVTDRATGRSKGYGFVKFGDEREQQRAMTEMNGVVCSSRPMRIGPAANKGNASGSTHRDERALAQSASMETLYGDRRTPYPFFLSPMARHSRTPYPFHYSAMARQTNALENGLTDGADKGEEDYEGRNASPFSRGYGEVQHQSSDCPLRLVICRFCGDTVQAGTSASNVRDRMRGLSEHESVCGSRTARCDSCGILLMLKLMDRHQIAVHRKTNIEMSEYKKEKGGSSRGVADAKDGKSILIVQTYHCLCVLNLKGHLNADGRYSPVLLRKTKLLEEGFPLFMGLVKLDKNDVYLFGGSRRGVYSDHTKDSEPSYYQLDFGSWSLKYTEEFDKTKAPKANPYVVKVDDKILAVEERFGFQIVKNISQPSIEYYDLKSNTWNEFPEIPAQKNWSKKDEALIRSGKHSGVLLIGYRFYIRFRGCNNTLFFCLNTRSHEWEDENASNMHASFGDEEFPNQGVCVSKLDGLDGDKNIILHCTCDRIYAYLFDDSGSLLCDQDITDELCRGIMPNYDNLILFVDLKRGGRMCMVSIEQRDYTEECENNTMNIRQFELEFKRGSTFKKKKFLCGQAKELSFVKVKIIENQQCAIPDVPEPELSLFDAVILQ